MSGSGKERAGRAGEKRFFAQNKPQSRSLTLIAKAQAAIEFLIDKGGFVPYTKAQFALALGWIDHIKGPDVPDRRLVEQVCNLTRDQEMYPEVEEVLGGYIVSYAPSQGGMTLLHPNQEQPLDGLLHVLVGDMQRQQSAQTTNRRRLPTWKTVGSRAANNSDHELARLAWQAEGEIDRTGFVQATTIGKLMKFMVSRGIID